MDKETLQIIDEMATRAATKAADGAVKNAIAQMRDFHQDDFKVLRERMDMGFESVERRFTSFESKVDARFDVIEQRLDSVETKINVVDQRFDRTENVLSELLAEFKIHREEVTDLKRQITELTLRVQVLEKQVANAH